MSRGNLIYLLGPATQFSLHVRFVELKIFGADLSILWYRIGAFFYENFKSIQYINIGGVDMKFIFKSLLRDYTNILCPILILLRMVEV